MRFYGRALLRLVARDALRLFGLQYALIGISAVVGFGYAGWLQRHGVLWLAYAMLGANVMWAFLRAVYEEHLDIAKLHTDGIVFQGMRVQALWNEFPSPTGKGNTRRHWTMSLTATLTNHSRFTAVLRFTAKAQVPGETRPRILIFCRQVSQYSKDDKTTISPGQSMKMELADLINGDASRDAVPCITEFRIEDVARHPARTQCFVDVPIGYEF